MINEELKTFIAKMRAAGKTDLEISAELKTAGWAESDINQALSEKSVYRFFHPGSVWDIFTIAPLVVFELMLLPISEFMLRIFSSMTDPSSISAGDFVGLGMAAALMGIMFPLSLAVMVLAVLDFIYLWVNRQKFARSTDETIKWVLLVLTIGVYAVPYIHFRYLKMWSRKKSLLLVGSLVLVSWVAASVQIIRVVMAMLRFKGML